MRYTDEDICIEFRNAVTQRGTRAVAREIGLSPAFVSLVTRGLCTPGPRVAAYLGYVDDGKRWTKQAKTGG